MPVSDHHGESDRWMAHDVIIGTNRHCVKGFLNAKLISAQKMCIWNRFLEGSFAILVHPKLASVSIVVQTKTRCSAECNIMECHSMPLSATMPLNAMQHH